MQNENNQLINCPVCHSSTHIYDVVDFNKSCEELRGKFLELSGIPIYYRMCNNCHFTFSPEIYQWSHSDFIEKIYNEDYLQVDPDYIKTRPENFANFLINIFKDYKEIRHLDYGGGNGLLSNMLVERNWDSCSYDPFPESNFALNELGKFNLITAFEVFEHVSNIDELIGNISSLITDNGLVIFSTLFLDGNLKNASRINWWYASPRNGHISLFSKKSIEIIAKKQNWKFGSLNHNIHIFYTNPPSWAIHLFKK